MMRLLQRWIAGAVLSVTLVAAIVSACYGREKIVPKPIKISDVAWRPGT